MKFMNSLNNVLVVLLLSFPIAISSQNYNQTDHVFTANLDAYSGVWEYRSSNEIFRVILKKGTENTRFVIGECLIGDYYYQKDGVVLDTYNENKIPLEINDSNQDLIIVGATNAKVKQENVNPNELYMFIFDKRLKKVGSSCEILLLSPTQIRWILADGEGVYSVEDILGFSIPTDVILTKIR